MVRGAATGVFENPGCMGQGASCSGTKVALDKPEMIA
jgi:hypothetical protein